MPMVYLNDKRAKTYAIPSHIIEDFEVSNVRLDDGRPDGGMPPELATNGSRLSSFLAALEVDITVGELSPLLAIASPGGSGTSPLGGLPSTLCAGLQGRDSHGGYAAGDDGWGATLCAGLQGGNGSGRYAEISGLAPTLCGGLQGSAEDLGQWARFFADPCLQSVRLRLKASAVKGFLYGAAPAESPKR